jgi:nucleoside-diphosphate-sugar epimerase
MRILITGASGFIGTAFIEEWRDKHDVLNMDIAPPLNRDQGAYWRKADILNEEQLSSVFSDFRPDCVLHLAARTDCDESASVEAGYRVNIEGTANVIQAVLKMPSVQRVVVVSSQYVCGPTYKPEHDEDFAPHTVYGQSKVITEQLTRQAELPCCWTIVRPVNIWGPWHMRYRQEFWRVVKAGLYMHPGGAPVMRCYGYVGNVVDQVNKIFEADSSAVNKQLFYVGDPPVDIAEWTNAFSVALTGNKVRRVPRCILRLLGAVGDVAEFAGLKFPITTSRYRSMTTDYIPDMSKTFELLGPSKFSLEEGVKKTVKWLEEYHD